MTTTIHETSHAVTASFSGRLDTASAESTAQAIKPLLDAEGKQIILDCKELEYISSSGLRVFLTIRKAAASHGCKVTVQNINANIRQVFTMTGFISLFDIQ